MTDDHIKRIRLIADYVEKIRSNEKARAELEAKLPHVDIPPGARFCPACGQDLRCEEAIEMLLAEIDRLTALFDLNGKVMGRVRIVDADGRNEGGE